jgi:hypothetical protein
MCRAHAINPHRSLRFGHLFITTSSRSVVDCCCSVCAALDERKESGVNRNARVLPRLRTRVRTAVGVHNVPVVFGVCTVIDSRVSSPQLNRIQRRRRRSSVFTDVCCRLASA